MTISGTTKNQCGFVIYDIPKGGAVKIAPVLEGMGFTFADTYNYEPASILWIYHKGYCWFSGIDITYGSSSSEKNVESADDILSYEEFCEKYVTDMAKAIYL